jgi:hypothetical protein
MTVAAMIGTMRRAIMKANPVTSGTTPRPITLAYTAALTPLPSTMAGTRPATMTSRPFHDGDEGRYYPAGGYDWQGHEDPDEDDRAQSEWRDEDHGYDEDE